MRTAAVGPKATSLSPLPTPTTSTSNRSANDVKRSQSRRRSIIQRRFSRVATPSPTTSRSRTSPPTSFSLISSNNFFRRIKRNNSKTLPKNIRCNGRPIRTDPTDVALRPFFLDSSVVAITISLGFRNRRWRAALPREKKRRSFDSPESRSASSGSSSFVTSGS